jgi:RNA polymerase sigma-70 factor, ECF subfamily
LKKTEAANGQTPFPRQPAHDLIQRCQNGERAAQYQLYQEYKDRVFGIVYRMANNPQDAEDLAQQVFVRVFQKIDTFRGQAAFSSWLYRLAMNICIDHVKKEKRHRQMLSYDTREDSEWAATDRDHRFDLKPHLQRAVNMLPARYRAVFILYQTEGYSHREIGEMLEISTGTSKSQLHKARRELRRLLAPVLTIKNVVG